MTGARVPSVLLALVLALAGLTGCVQVPTTGPIKPVAGQAETCQNCINVEVAPPAPGAEPQEVVRGYLRATASYQPNYTTAKQFLTTTAAETWRPEAGVTIFDASLVPGGDTVRLRGQQVGGLKADRTYTAEDKPLDWDFGLRQENGEWRISRPPDGLMVADYSFNQFYSAYSIFFVGHGESLVPERIYLPALRNPDNVASALLTALLDGPSEWLDPAVDSALPTEASPSVSSVTITDGIAEVPLNDAVLTLPDPKRSQMAAQIVYTLRQVSGVKGVLITVNKQKFGVPGADPTSLVVTPDAFSRDIDPVLFATDQLYAVRDGRVFLVTTPSETPGLQEMAGPLGRENRSAANSVAVSISGTDLAVVSERRTALHRAATSTGVLTPLETGLTGMLRPQFTRYGELWTLGRARGGQQQFWVSSLERAAAMDTRALTDGRKITAFRISPDGSRMALVRQAGNRFELGLARIIRGDKVAVDGWRQVDLTVSETTKVDRIADVAWLDANELLLLGTPSTGAGPVPIRVAVDASRITVEAGLPDWNADQLTVLHRPQTAIVIGDDHAWRDNGTRWSSFLEDIDTVAYAG